MCVCVCVCASASGSLYPATKWAPTPCGLALSRWPRAYFLCVLLLFAVDFLCAKMGVGVGGERTLG